MISHEDMQNWIKSLSPSDAKAFSERVHYEYSKKYYRQKIQRYWKWDASDPRNPRQGMAGPKHLEAHKCRTFGRILKGANKSGKTVWGAVESYWWLTGSHPFRVTPKPPLYGRVVCPELPLSLDNPHPVRQSLLEWWPPDELRGGSWEKAWSTQGNTLHLENGSILEFVSAKQEARTQAGAVKIAFVWFDEEWPHSIHTENILRLDLPGSGWWATYAPLGDEPWIGPELFAPAYAGKLPSVRAWVFDMEADNLHNLGKEFVDKMKGVAMRESEKSVRLHGVEGKPEGAVFGDVEILHINTSEIDLELTDPEDEGGIE